MIARVPPLLPRPDYDTFSKEDTTDAFTSAKPAPQSRRALADALTADSSESEALIPK
jgi:hypothetical protein